MAKDSRIVPVPLGKATFLDAPRCDDLDTLEADVAIIGVPLATPTTWRARPPPSSTAPAAVRAQSVRWAPYITHYDYDFGADIFAGREVRIVDCGDVAMTPGAYAENSAATTGSSRRSSIAAPSPSSSAATTPYRSPSSAATRDATRWSSSSSTSTSTGAKSAMGSRRG